MPNGSCRERDEISQADGGGRGATSGDGCLCDSCNGKSPCCDRGTARGDRRRSCSTRTTSRSPSARFAEASTSCRPTRPRSWSRWAAGEAVGCLALPTRLVAPTSRAPPTASQGTLGAHRGRVPLGHRAHAVPAPLLPSLSRRRPRRQAVEEGDYATRQLRVPVLRRSRAAPSRWTRASPRRGWGVASATPGPTPPRPTPPRAFPQATSIDHVIPTSKGGEDSWQNCVACCQVRRVLSGAGGREACGSGPVAAAWRRRHVTARQRRATPDRCQACNGKKGDKLLKQTNMKLRSTPRDPKCAGRHVTAVRPPCDCRVTAVWPSCSRHVTAA